MIETPLGEGAVGLHEWFVSLVDAGFTETQALTLIAKTIALSGKDKDDE